MRLARADDGLAMKRLHRRAILATGPAFYSAELRQSWASGLRPEGYAEAMRDGEVFDVAVDEEDTPVAFCGRKDGTVKGLYVDPAYQGRGIAALLLKRAERRLAEEGVTAIRIDASLPAVAFYEKQGYARGARHLDRTRGGLEIESLWMTKILDSV
ncbi:MAG: GNAT family N-acetyltransferase [Kiloniellales bacterium]